MVNGPSDARPQRAVTLYKKLVYIKKKSAAAAGGGEPKKGVILTKKPDFDTFVAGAW